MLVRLTERKILQIARQSHAKTSFYRDTQLPGLAVKITPYGHIGFVVDARIRHGRTRRIRLGTHPAMNLQRARARAKEVLSEMQAGRDPVALEHAAKAEESRRRAADQAAAKTLGDVADAFLSWRLTASLCKRIRVD